jgi:hypothetical protein
LAAAAEAGVAGAETTEAAANLGMDTGILKCGEMEAEVMEKEEEEQSENFKTEGKEG